MNILEKPVSNIMTTSLISLDLNTHNLKDAESLFRKHNIRHLPVIDHHVLVGIISQTDIQRLSFADNFGEEEHDIDTAIYEMLTLSQVMVRKPITVTEKQTIGEVAKIFTMGDFHALPVVRNQKIVGIVTTTDIIKLLLQQATD